MNLFTIMTYPNPKPSQLKFFVKNFVSYNNLYNAIVDLQSVPFQTQSGRDQIRETLIKLVESVVSINNRFPGDGKFYVFVAGAAVDSVWQALLQSSDTRNRAIEVDEPKSVTTAEQMNAVRRTDDSSTAIRANINQLLTLLNSGTDVYDRDLFERESGLVWSESQQAQTT